VGLEFKVRNLEETLSLPTESLVILSHAFSPAFGGIVSVTKICSNGELFILSNAFPEKRPKFSI